MGLSDLSVMLDLIAEKVDFKKKMEPTGSKNFIGGIAAFVAGASQFYLLDPTKQNILIRHLAKLEQFNSFSEDRIMHYIGFKSFFPEKKYAYPGYMDPEDKLLIREKIKRINEIKIYNNIMDVVKGKLNGKSSEDIEKYLNQITQFKERGFSILKANIASLETKSEEKLIAEIFNYYSQNFSLDTLKAPFTKLYNIINPLYEQGFIGDIKKDRSSNHFKGRYKRHSYYFSDTPWIFQKDFVVLDYIYQLLAEYRRVIRLDQIQKIMAKERDKRNERVESLIRLLESGKPIINFLSISTIDKISYFQEVLKEIKNIKKQIDYLNFIYFKEMNPDSNIGRPKLINEYTYILQCYDFAKNVKQIKNAKEWTSSILNLIIEINNLLNKGLDVDEIYYYRTEDNVKEVVKAARKLENGAENMVLSKIFNNAMLKNRILSTFRRLK